MDAGSAFIDILIFGAVAAFLVLRLRNVLGRRMGHERDGQVERPVTEMDSNIRHDEKIVPLPGITMPDSETADGVGEIQRADRSFQPDEFCVGARTAFELILSAFSTGDRDTLRQLCNSDVYQLLDGVMADRESREETLEATLVRIKSADIIEAGMFGDKANVTLRFVSEQINVTRDAEGHAISGNHGVIDVITDIWTFTRDTRSQDPNWTLAEIRDEDPTDTEDEA